MGPLNVALMGPPMEPPCISGGAFALLYSVLLREDGGQSVAPTISQLLMRAASESRSIPISHPASPWREVMKSELRVQNIAQGNFRAWSMPLRVPEVLGFRDDF